MLLQDKIAVVTGASRGIGRATAKALAREGAMVIVNYNGSKERADEVVSEIEKDGGHVFMSRTGTSFTEANTKINNIPLGGELSGHIFFNDRGPEVCSAIYAGLRFIEILSKEEKTFSELLKGINNYYSTPEIKVPCSNKHKFEVVDAVKKYVIEKKYSYLDIDGVRVNFKNAWGLIRASNTGPNLTLRFEGITNEDLESIKNEFTNVVNETIKRIDI